MKNKETVTTSATFVEAAKISCKSKMIEAEAKIALYANTPQGVADHSKIMEEILQAAEQGSHAEDVLRFLEKVCP